MALRNLACECAPLPVPRVRSRVGPRYEPSDRAALQALACGGELGAERCGHSSFDGGAHRPGPRRVLKY